MRTRAWKLVAPALFTAAIAIPGSAHAGDGTREVIVYGINQFGGSGECGDPGMTHEYHTQSAAAFRWTFELMQGGLQWESVLTANNSNARGSRWTDPSKECLVGATTCNKNDDGTYGVDSADVAYIHTHGGHEDNNSDGHFSYLVMGNSEYGCNARTDRSMKLGNTDLNIAVAKACQSGQYQVWQDGWYDTLVADSGEFSVWNAFHGDSSCDGDTVDYVGDYSIESINDGVGENWLDEAYDNWGYDDCPVSIVFGQDGDTRRDMYHWGGWADLKDTGDRQASTYFYVENCNPENGYELPG